VLVAPLPLITWLTAQRLGLPRPLGIAAAVFPLAIPQLSHIGSVVNNDSLMLLLFWLVTPLVIALARGDLRPRVALLAGVVTGLALFTKGFALVMPLWVVAALAVALGRAGRERLRAVGVAAGVYAAATLALGGWWWLRNLVAYGNPMPTRYYEVIRPTPDVDRDYGHFLDIWARLSTRLFWGTFGWVDVSIPEAVWHTATAVCVVALLLACIRPDRLAGIPIGDRLLLLAPLLLLMGIQLALSLRAYVNRGLLAGMQGRYWFGALVGIGILIALGVGGLRRSWARWLPAGTLAAAAAMQAVGITTMLDHYWGGPQASLGDRLRAVVAWAPLPGELIGAGALAATVAVAGLGVVVVREAAGWGGPQSNRSTSRLTASASSPDTQAMSPMPVTQATSVDHHT
jgi:4-amino-4-deoxy-L-arabinose transferase-like glycosyltransferase